MDELGNGCSGSSREGNISQDKERQTHRGGQGFQAGKLVTRTVKDRRTDATLRESLYMSSRSFLEALLLCVGIIFQCHPQSQVPMTQPLCTPPSRSQEQVGIETKICLFEERTAFSLV